MTNVILVAMENKLFQKLEQYKEENNLTNAELAQKLGVPEVYIYRWANKGVKGIYAKVVKDFLK